MFAYIYERPSSVWIKTLNAITEEDSCKMVGLKLPSYFILTV